MLPALTIGTFATEPLRLTMQDKQQTDIDALSEHVRIEVVTTPERPYVNSQILYTVRMLYDEWLVDGNLGNPVFAKAYSRKLNKHYSYETERDGHRYKVSEYRYIVFPEHSGRFVIPGPVFSGAIAYPGYTEHEDTQCRSPLEFSTAATSINVRPPPATYDEPYWLPAEQLILSVTPNEQAAQLLIGEPLIRKIMITAKGLPAAAIPELPLPQIAGAQIYAGLRQADTRLSDDGLTSVIEQTITVISTRSGRLTLPAVSLSWWDTGRQSKQSSSLPARTMTILPGGDTHVAEGQAVIPFRDDRASVSALSRHQLISLLYTFIFAGLMIILFYTGLVRHGWQYYRQQLAMWLARNHIRTACRRHDPTAAAHALLDWSETLWPGRPAVSLGELGRRL